MRSKKAVSEANPNFSDSGAAQAVKSEDQIRYFFGIFRKNDTLFKKILKSCFGIPIMIAMITYLGVETFYNDFICNIPKICNSLISLIKSLKNKAFTSLKTVCKIILLFSEHLLKIIYHLILALVERGHLTTILFASHLKKLFRFFLIMADHILVMALKICKKLYLGMFKLSQILGNSLKFSAKKVSSFFNNYIKRHIQYVAFSCWTGFKAFVSQALHSLKFLLAQIYQLIKLVTIYLSKLINSFLSKITLIFLDFIRTLTAHVLVVFKRVKNFVGGKSKALKNFVLNAFKYGKYCGEQLLRCVINCLKKSGEWLFRIVTSITNAFRKKTVEAKSLLRKLIIFIFGILLKILNTLKKTISDAKNSLKQLALSIFEIFLKIYRKSFLPAFKFLLNLTSKGISLQVRFCNMIFRFIRFIGLKAKALIFQLASIIKMRIKYLIDHIKKSLHVIINSISSFYSYFYGSSLKFLRTLEKVLKAVASFIKNVSIRVMEFVEKTISLIVIHAIKCLKNLYLGGKNLVLRIRNSKIVVFSLKMSRFVLLKSFEIMKMCFEFTAKTFEFLKRKIRSLVYGSKETVLVVFSLVKRILRSGQAAFTKYLVKFIDVLFSVQNKIFKFLFRVISILFKGIVNILVFIFKTLYKIGDFCVRQIKSVSKYLFKRIVILIKKFCNVAKYCFKHGKNNLTLLCSKLLVVVKVISRKLKWLMILLIKIVIGVPYIVFKKGRVYLPKLWNALKQFFTPIVLKLKNKLTTLIEFLCCSLKLLFSKLKNFACEIWKIAKLAANKVINLLKRGYQKLASIFMITKRILFESVNHSLHFLHVVYTNIKNAVHKKLSQLVFYLIRCKTIIAAFFTKCFFAPLKTVGSKLLSHLLYLKRVFTSFWENLRIQITESFHFAKLWVIKIKDNIILRVLALKLFYSRYAKLLKEGARELVQLTIINPTMAFKNTVKDFVIKLREYLRSARNAAASLWSEIKESIKFMKSTILKEFLDRKEAFMRVKASIQMKFKLFKEYIIQTKSNLSCSLKGSLSRMKLALKKNKDDLKISFLDLKSRLIVLKQGVKNSFRF